MGIERTSLEHEDNGKRGGQDSCMNESEGFAVLDGAGRDM
jgi:hypothetical protein